nr:MAG TPA: protein of unknown function (DUF4750) [Caudoviricetes sp.]
MRCLLTVCAVLFVLSSGWLVVFRFVALRRPFGSCGGFSLRSIGCTGSGVCALWGVVGA